MSSVTATKEAIRRLPLFMAYCPDYPSVLAKRLEVRPAHFQRWAKDKESGRAYFGLGYLPPSGSASTPSDITLPPGVQPMAGSLLIFHSESLDTAWNRLKEDEYWTAGVWDREKMVVNQFITPPEGHLYGSA